MPSDYGEFSGGPGYSPPSGTSSYPTKTAQRQLQAGYTRGTDDITDPLDPRVWTGEVKLEDDPYRDLPVSNDVNRLE